MPLIHSAPVPDFHTRLKHNTGQLHRDLEALPLSQAMVSPQLTKSQYIAYLSQMLTIISYVESEALTYAADIITDSTKRVKREWIINDLSCLGVNVPKKPLTGLLTIPSKGFALGVLYVIEGSTLGGRYILKNISETLGLTADSGASYFNGYGNQTGLMWKNFMSMLSAYESANGNSDDIIAGANEAFNLIYEHLSTTA